MLCRLIMIFSYVSAFVYFITRIILNNSLYLIFFTIIIKGYLINNFDFSLITIYDMMLTDYYVLYRYRKILLLSKYCR